MKNKCTITLQHSISTSSSSNKMTHKFNPYLNKSGIIFISVMVFEVSQASLQ